MPYSEKFAKLVERISEHPDHLVAVIVHLNDTYLLDERKAQGFPGFPRLIATVGELRKVVAEVAKRRSDGCLSTTTIASSSFTPATSSAPFGARPAISELLTRLRRRICYCNTRCMNLAAVAMTSSPL